MTASLGGSLHSSFRSILHGGRARGQWKPNVETGESRNGQNSVMSDAAESSLASAEIWQRDRDQVPYEAYRRVFEHTGDDVVSVNSEETLSPRAVRIEHGSAKWPTKEDVETATELCASCKCRESVTQAVTLAHGLHRIAFSR